MMQVTRTGSRVFMEDLGILRLEDVRWMVGGQRKFKAATQVTLRLPDGREVVVGITRRPGVLGGSVQFFACPVCGRPCRVLRVVPDAPALACNRCLQSSPAVKYRSQVVTSSAGRCA